jgi:hypothetical protein
MRARSWMAALALVVGTSIAVGRAMPALVTSQAPDNGKTEDAGKVKSPSKSPDSKPPGTRVSSVQLDLVVAGLGDEGCEVQVKPGNASCKFSPVYRKRGENHQFIAADGHGRVELRDIELRGADRTITVAITVREKGQAAKTFYRGFRLKTKPDKHDQGAVPAAPTFTCYLSSPSKLAKSEESRARR